LENLFTRQRLEEYLQKNNVIDTSVQKDFITGPGVFEHVYSLSAILQDAISTKRPLMITFLDLKNAFGSVPHQLIFDMLRAVKVSSRVQSYIKLSFPSYLLLLLLARIGKPPIPFLQGVLQGDTMSPIFFLIKALLSNKP